MEVQEVEFRRTLTNPLKHCDMQGIGIADRRIEAQGGRPDRVQLS